MPKEELGLQESTKMVIFKINSEFVVLDGFSWFKITHWKMAMSASSNSSYLRQRIMFSAS